MNDLIHDLRTIFFEEEEELGRFAADEIERLKEELSNESSLRIEEEGRLCERIEELESGIDHWQRTAEYIANNRGVFITHAQIDMAQEVAESLKTKFPKIADAIIDTLELFNIVACKGCDGNKNKLTTIDHNMYGEPVRANLPCPDCDGHGWIIASDAICSKRSADND